jgi:hypothetical protein
LAYNACKHLTTSAWSFCVISEDEEFDFTPDGKNPISLAVRVTIVQAGQPDKTIDLPTNLLIPPADYCDGVEFAITRVHPFKEIAQQNALADTLKEVFLVHHEEGDTYETQEAEFDRELSDLLTKMFGGRKEAAMKGLREAVWRDSIGFNLKQAGIKAVTMKLVKGEWVIDDVTPKRKAKKK